MDYKLALVIVAIITIVLPLLTGKYLYRGALKKISYGLAVAAIFCGFIFVSESLTTVATFKKTCQSLSGYTYAGNFVDYKTLTCWGPGENDTVYLYETEGVVSKIITIPAYLIFLTCLFNPLLALAVITKRRLANRKRAK